MFRQFMSTVVEALLSIPPIRFVMGLVDARWRPLWATLWLAAIAYLLSRTMNQLALRRARLRLLKEPQAFEGEAAVRTAVDASGTATTDSVNTAPPAATPRLRPAESAAAAPSAVAMVPMPVVVGAVLVGAIVVTLTAVLLRRTPPNEATPPTPLAASGDSAPGGALDVRWRSGRPNGDDCVATFEVTRGSGTRARFVAFVMDSSGAVMARDSARVESAITGLLVDFRFRHVSCEEIADWQLQATTPKVPTP